MVDSTSENPRFTWREYKEYLKQFSEHAQQWRCACESYDEPPCWALLYDPIAVLRDRARWPRRLCYEVGRELTERWVRTQFTPIINSLDDWFRYEYPVPIGRQALMDVDAVQFQDNQLERFHAGRVLPFDENQYATVVLAMELPVATVVFFGTAEKVAEDDFTYFELTDSMFQILGPRPDDQAALNLIKLARGWWRRFRGKRIHDSNQAGRPVGSGFLASPEEFRDRVFPVIKEVIASGKRPTQTLVCEHLSKTWLVCSPRQLRRWFQSFGWSSWNHVLTDVAEDK